MTTTATQSAATPPDLFWAALEAEHAQTFSPSRRARQAELLRLRDVINSYRSRYFPELPAVTVIGGDSMTANVLAFCSPIGGWGQGIALTVRGSLLEQITPRTENRDRISVIWGLPMRLDDAGEQLRQLEVDLAVLHELVHAEHQWRHARGEDVGYESEAASYGAHGRWFLARCNEVWRAEAERLGLPFAPVRHSRVKREQEQQFVVEDDTRLQPLTYLRSSCAQWPFDAIAAPWKGQTPSNPTEEQQQAIELLPALIAAHHSQALAGTNAAAALAAEALPPPPALGGEPAPAVREVVIEPDHSKGFTTPWDPAGAIETVERRMGARDFGTYLRFLELATARRLDLITTEPQPTARPDPATAASAADPAAITSPPALPPTAMAKQPAPTVEDLAHHAEDRIAQAAARDPLLGDVITLLRTKGELATTADWEEIANAHGFSISTARNRATKARSLLVAACVEIPRKPRVGDVVALSDSPATTGVIAAVAGTRAHVEVHGTGRWLMPLLTELDVIGVIGTERVVRNAAAQERAKQKLARIRERRAQAAQPTATEISA